jgi:hypothetical protein
MNATETLKRLADKYSQCKSYADYGIVDFDDVNQKKQQIEFKTEFVRPDYFTFEWQDYGPRRGKSERFSMLWSDAMKTLIRQDTGKVVLEEQPNLRRAVAGATGCSAGAAHLVPALLMEEIRADSRHVLQLTGVELISEDFFEGHNCYVLSGSLFKERDYVLWVSVDDFSLRRVTVTHSQTAQEAEREHQALLANTELMERMTQRGIAPPVDMQYKDTHSITEYTYTTVCFDELIARLPQPV